MRYTIFLVDRLFRTNRKISFPVNQNSGTQLLSRVCCFRFQPNLGIPKKPNLNLESVTADFEYLDSGIICLDIKCHETPPSDYFGVSCLSYADFLTFGQWLKY